MNCCHTCFLMPHTHPCMSSPPPPLTLYACRPLLSSPSMSFCPLLSSPCLLSRPPSRNSCEASSCCSATGPTLPPLPTRSSSRWMLFARSWPGAEGCVVPRCVCSGDTGAACLLLHAGTCNCILLSCTALCWWRGVLAGHGGTASPFDARHILQQPVMSIAPLSRSAGAASLTYTLSGFACWPCSLDGLFNNHNVVTHHVLLPQVSRTAILAAVSRPPGRLQSGGCCYSCASSHQGGCARGNTRCTDRAVQ